jgi:predicted transcriptional regulator
MKRLVAVKKAMVEQGISVLRISHDLGINPSLFSMYANGWRQMPNTLKEEVAHYLNAEPEKLFDDYHE